MAKKNPSNNPYKIPKMERMATPTFVVGRKDFERLAYYKDTKYIVHGIRRAKPLMPDMATQIDDDRVYFPTAPKTIIFRKRFSFRKVERRLSQMIADRGDRYDFQLCLLLNAD